MQTISDHTGIGCEDARGVTPEFRCRVNEQIELRLLNVRHAAELLGVPEANREHLGRWMPAWGAGVFSAEGMEAMIDGWQRQMADRRAFYFGIWFEGHLCGMICYLNVDWNNRSTALAYWLDEAHQGRGIVTTCCRTMVAHAFRAWQFNRVSIECATENVQSRAVPERLGFKFEGIIRGVERLQDRFVDHAMYGLLSSDIRFVAKPGGGR